MPAWKSPSDAAPSPKKTAAQFFPRRFGSRFNAKATPAACGICVASGEEIVLKWYLRDPKCYTHHVRVTANGRHKNTRNWHLLSLRACIFITAKALSHNRIIVKAPPHEDTHLAVLTQNPIRARFSYSCVYVTFLDLLVVWCQCCS